MVGHRTQFDALLEARVALDPAHEVAARARGEEVERHHHRPQAESGRHDEILGSGAAQHLEFRPGEALQGLSVDEKFAAGQQAVAIDGERLHGAGAQEVAMRAEALGEIGEEKLHPARPEEHRTRDAPERLARVAPLEGARQRDEEACKAHRKGGAVQRPRAEEMLHEDHQRMAQRHEQQDEDEGGYGFEHRRSMSSESPMRKLVPVVSGAL